MRYVIANWKMYPKRRAEAVRIGADSVARARGVKGVRVALCPPFVWLEALSSLVKAPVWLGAQDTFWADEGAYTGEVSPAMLKDMGCALVIVGHSERRQHLAESQELIAKKLAAALKQGFYAVLCVGERQREGEWEKELVAQTRSALTALGEKEARRLIIAYEPVWAIGTGKADTPREAVTSILLIRRVLRDTLGEGFERGAPVLYGGSINANNAEAFAQEQEIDGFLVGHASLDPSGFAAIVTAAQPRMTRRSRV